MKVIFIQFILLYLTINCSNSIKIEERNLNNGFEFSKRQSLILDQDMQTCILNLNKLTDDKLSILRGFVDIKFFNYNILRTVRIIRDLNQNDLDLVKSQTSINQLADNKQEALYELTRLNKDQIKVLSKLNTYDQDTRNFLEATSRFKDLTQTDLVIINIEFTLNLTRDDLFNSILIFAKLDDEQFNRLKVMVNQRILPSDVLAFFKFLSKIDENKLQFIYKDLTTDLNLEQIIRSSIKKSDTKDTNLIENQLMKKNSRIKNRQNRLSKLLSDLHSFTPDKVNFIIQLKDLGLFSESLIDQITVIKSVAKNQLNSKPLPTNLAEAVNELNKLSNSQLSLLSKLDTLGPRFTVLLKLVDIIKSLTDTQLKELIMKLNMRRNIQIVSLIKSLRNIKQDQMNELQNLIRSNILPSNLLTSINDLNQIAADRLDQFLDVLNSGGLLERSFKQSIKKKSASVTELSTSLTRTTPTRTTSTTSSTTESDIIEQDKPSTADMSATRDFIIKMLPDINNFTPERINMTARLRDLDLLSSNVIDLVNSIKSIRRTELNQFLLNQQNMPDNILKIINDLEKFSKDQLNLLSKIKEFGPRVPSVLKLIENLKQLTQEQMSLLVNQLNLGLIENKIADLIIAFKTFKPNQLSELDKLINSKQLPSSLLESVKELEQITLDRLNKLINDLNPNGLLEISFNQKVNVKAVSITESVRTSQITNQQATSTISVNTTRPTNRTQGSSTSTRTTTTMTAQQTQVTTQSQSIQTIISDNLIRLVTDLNLLSTDRINMIVQLKDLALFSPNIVDIVTQIKTLKRTDITNINQTKSINSLGENVIKSINELSQLSSDELDVLSKIKDFGPRVPFLLKLIENFKSLSSSQMSSFVNRLKLGPIQEKIVDLVKSFRNLKADQVAEMDKMISEGILKSEFKNSLSDISQISVDRLNKLIDDMNPNGLLEKSFLIKQRSKRNLDDMEIFDGMTNEEILNVLSGPTQPNHNHLRFISVIQFVINLLEEELNKLKNSIGLVPSTTNSPISDQGSYSGWSNEDKKKLYLMFKDLKFPSNSNLFN